MTVPAVDDDDVDLNDTDIDLGPEKLLMSSTSTKSLTKSLKSCALKAS